MNIEVNQTWCGPYEVHVSEPARHKCICLGPRWFGGLYAYTCRNGRQIERCLQCGGEDDIGPARDGAITKDQLDDAMGDGKR